MRSRDFKLHFPQQLLALLLLAATTSAWGLPWDQDMVDQPSAKPQESATPAEPNAVPIEGGETLPSPSTEKEIFAAKDAAAGIPNPVPATAESIARGAAFYETNCRVCHGKQGHGDGPVGVKFLENSPVDLNEAHTQDQTDGELFFTITRGRIEMPFYRDALSQGERWDLINFIRDRFGKRGVKELENASNKKLVANNLGDKQ
jgi:mono/diheme cytochrome c family protein